MLPGGSMPARNEFPLPMDVHVEQLMGSASLSPFLVSSKELSCLKHISPTKPRESGIPVRWRLVGVEVFSVVTTAREFSILFNDSFSGSAHPLRLRDWVGDALTSRLLAQSCSGLFGVKWVE